MALCKGDWMKKTENLKEALEEARTRRALGAEEEGRRKPVYAAVEGRGRPCLSRAKMWAQGGIGGLEGTPFVGVWRAKPCA